MIKDLEGKVAVITGAGSGIGKGMALAFAKKGMKLVISDINESSLNVVKEKLEKEGTEVLSLLVDVSDKDQVQKLADFSYEQFHKVHVLCNNAGVGTFGPLHLLSLKDWEFVLGINLFGPIFGVNAFLPRMLQQQEQCHIVNTASIAGLIPANEGPYNVSKSGVVALSERIATECADTNVGVSVLCPQLVDTNIVDNSIALGENYPGLFHHAPEIKEAGKSFIETFKGQLKAGLSCERIAEMVIYSIQNGIVYIFTHPDLLPALNERFNAIKKDALKLKEEFYTK